MLLFVLPCVGLRVLLRPASSTRSSHPLQPTSPLGRRCRAVVLAFALPFGLSQPFLGPAGDAFGKVVVIKAATAVLALCLLASALAPNLTVLFVSRVLGGVAAGGIMPVCMALIGDSFPLAVRQVALSRYIGATLVGQLVGASVGDMIAEWIGWRGVLGCAAALAVIAAGTAIWMLPSGSQGSAPSAERTPSPLQAGPQ